MNNEKASSPDKVKKKLEKVSDHLKIQNEALKKMYGKLSVGVKHKNSEDQ